MANSTMKDTASLKLEVPVSATVSTSLNPKGQAPQDSTGNRPHATQNDHGKPLEFDGTTHIRRQGVEVKSVENAGRPAQGRGNKEGKGDDSPDIDSQQHGRAIVFRHSPDGLAHAAIFKKQGQDHHEQGDHGHDAYLQRGDRHCLTDVPDVDLDRAGWKAYRACSEQSQGHAFKDNGHGNARYQAGKMAVRALPQRGKGHGVEQKTKQPGQHGSRGKCQPNRHACGLNEPQGAKAAQGEYRGMGQVQNVQDTEDQGVAHSKKAVDAADKQPVDQLLRQQVHPICLSDGQAPLLAEHGKLAAFDLLNHGEMVRIPALGKGKFAQ
jgi:hypothetical protein